MDLEMETLIWVRILNIEFYSDILVVSALPSIHS